MKLPVPSSSISRPTSLFFLFTSNPGRAKPICNSVQFLQFRAKGPTITPKMVVKACVKIEQKESSADLVETSWGKVSSVLFDMDGVLCNSEEPSRMAAVDVFAEMGVQCTVEDFVPFTGTGEANFLGGVARVKGVKDFNVEAAKKRFFEIYLEKYAKPNSGIGFPGALELITQCKEKGLKVAVASSADRVKVDANLAAIDLLNSKCANSLQNLKQIHTLILRTGHFEDPFVSGVLLKRYANPQFRNLDSAFAVFDCVSNPNVFVYNVLIKACLDNNEPFDAVMCYSRMMEANLKPNKFTFPPLMKSCGALDVLKEGAQVHGHVIKFGLNGDGHIRSSGIQMYAGFGCMDSARRMLEIEDGKSDVVCYNAAIDGYFKSGDGESARELFERMVDRSVGSWNVMVSGLAKLGMVKEAREVFDGMPERDDISWSAMIDGYIQAGFYKEALEVFELMQKGGIRPKKYALSSVLAACANVGALDQGRWIHAYIKKNPISLDSVLGTALIDMYAKCGQLELAWDVFESMKHKQVFTWNAMICGLAMHGRAEDAIQLFTKMQKEKRKPNGITFVGILNACAHNRMVNEGLKILDSMKTVYGVEPEMEHYGCVVDLLGRSGRLAEAEEFIRSMPVEPSGPVWGALLGACRVHGNPELGEKVGKILLELEPQNSGRYALLSNIYAKAGRWDDVAEVRRLMKERGVKTTTGTSMTDLGGIVHEFKMGDGSHPQMRRVYQMLESMIERLEIEGYSPNTSQVLFDIEEEEKETALYYHSEKLAIAFGLINTEPGMTIRVVKNLRMCEDCHVAVKLISKVYNREIIVRDRTRYHHFKNGVCSCKDFW